MLAIRMQMNQKSMIVSCTAMVWVFGRGMHVLYGKGRASGLLRPKRESLLAEAATTRSSSRKPTVLGLSARPAGWLSSLDTDSMAATYGIRSHDARMYGELVCLSVYSLVCKCSPHLSRSARLIAEDD